LNVFVFHQPQRFRNPHAKDVEVPTFAEDSPEPREFAQDRTRPFSVEKSGKCLQHGAQSANTAARLMDSAHFGFATSRFAAAQAVDDIALGGFEQLA